MSKDQLKENGFTLKKRRYPAETLTDADYAGDPALLANTPAQAESLLHSLEQAARRINFYIYSDKTEFMRFKQDVAITLLNDKPLKLVDLSHIL